jgi:DNA-binding response OmpR family regulator
MTSRAPILVVDDDGPILLLMRNLLREFGYEAITAATGEQAVAAARDRRPALVLLDRNMPGMHGDEVVRALREEVGLDGVPILIVSGDPVTRHELAELGADGAVQKPFDVPSLIAQIRGFVTADVQ